MDLTILLVPLLGGAETDAAEADLSSAHGALTVRRAPRGGSVPRRRLAGLHGVSTELVAIIEDTTRIGPGWVAAMTAAFAGAPRLGAAGGPVLPGASLPPDHRGLLAFDYGPFTAGYTGDELPGNALCFRTAALTAALTGADGVREAEVLTALRAAGWTTRYLPEATATYEAADPNSLRSAAQLRQGRAWAGRARQAGRLAGVAGLARLPAWPVAALRWGRAARRAGPHPAAQAAAARLSLAWAIGEAIGVVLGPGRGEEAWR